MRIAIHLIAAAVLANPAQAIILVPSRPVTFSAAAQGTPAALFGIGLNGFVDETREAALGADLFLQLDSVSPDRTRWNFTARIDNTSDTSLLSSARITAFGFSTAISARQLFFQQISSVNRSSDIFTVTAATNVSTGLAMPELSPRPQLCFKAGGATNNCAGGGGGGLGAGTPAHTMTFALNFTEALSALTLRNFVVRYQSISGTGAGGTVYNDASGVGYADVVPEPASWAMLIAGFGLVGAAMRRRVRVAAV
jgi:hypothetical protein